MSSEFKSLVEAIEYGKSLNADTNVYYSEDSFPHGHWHVVWASHAGHYNKLEGWTLKAKLRVRVNVEMV